ncbi:uncharacterized protein C2845_PM07G17060 [Panicum miliaceum]|uniref:Uncharacterized protein n=1 Tax=Panicum miliaceum TaxID=4540 RepID=A0A3L6SU45_PANMI|nr:uncharacterized protein C2845_PM07G17060 [Panicum miliaceum]
MFSAMSAVLSSLARRLVPFRRRKSITPSGFAARRPFFPCGAGHRDVSDDSPFVVKRGRTLRKVMMKPRRVGGRGGGKGGEHLLDGDGDEPCVWRRTILLGRRCQPLEFTGAIHYDCEGQRLWQPRTPPQSSPLLMSPVHLHPSELGYMDRA